jgi:CheY-like chemotaxis protein
MNMPTLSATRRLLCETAATAYPIAWRRRPPGPGRLNSPSTERKPRARRLAGMLEGSFGEPEREEDPVLAPYVLLVEDDADTSAVMRDLLADELGVSVAIAPTGPEALLMARRRPPAVMLLDLLVAGTMGDDLCNEMKSDPLTAAVPVVAVTAAAPSDPRATALRECADEWLPKPFDVDLLLATVEQYL